MKYVNIILIQLALFALSACGKSEESIETPVVNKENCTLVGPAKFRFGPQLISKNSRPRHFQTKFLS